MRPRRARDTLVRPASVRRWQPLRSSLVRLWCPPRYAMPASLICARRRTTLAAWRNLRVTLVEHALAYQRCTHRNITPRTGSMQNTRPVTSFLASRTGAQDLVGASKVVAAGSTGAQQSTTMAIEHTRPSQTNRRPQTVFWSQVRRSEGAQLGRGAAPAPAATAHVCHMTTSILFKTHLQCQVQASCHVRRARRTMRRWSSASALSTRCTTARASQRW
jgi:hypothetical protein